MLSLSRNLFCWQLLSHNQPLRSCSNPWPLSRQAVLLNKDQSLWSTYSSASLIGHGNKSGLNNKEKVQQGWPASLQSEMIDAFQIFNVGINISPHLTQKKESAPSEGSFFRSAHTHSCISKNLSGSSRSMLNRRVVLWGVSCNKAKDSKLQNVVCQDHWARTGFTSAAAT